MSDRLTIEQRHNNMAAILIGSGVYCIDETREELGKEPLNTDWSRKHFITKNFEEIDRFLKGVAEGGEGKSE